MPQHNPAAKTLAKFILQDETPSADTLELAHALQIESVDDFELAMEIWKELREHPIVKAFQAIDHTVNMYDQNFPFVLAKVDVSKVPARYLRVMQYLLWQSAIAEYKSTGKLPNIPGIKFGRR